jgi:hypothetical protein
MCESVAAMHNLRPALLHRDLKVYSLLSMAYVPAYRLAPLFNHLTNL